MDYDNLREKALANFELLLDLWGLQWRDIGRGEYDFKSPNRQDRNFGACRFNIEKGWGCDFAGTGTLSKHRDYSQFGEGFDSSDFSAYDLDGNTAAESLSFDVIGLCGRVHAISNYRDSAKRLQADIREIGALPGFVKIAADAAIQRKAKVKRKNDEKVILVKDIWESCKNNTLVGTAAHTYLTKRKILLPSEPNIRFHPLIRHYGTKANLPCILFKVQQEPTGPQVALHRIFLRKDGSGKADIPNPKMALASIAGAGIWLGTPGHILVICEGPENAISARTNHGHPFVVCTINAVNFGALTIPSIVKEIILIPDPDEAGRKACLRAQQSYQSKDRRMFVDEIDEVSEWTTKMT